MTLATPFAMAMTTAEDGAALAWPVAEDESGAGHVASEGAVASSEQPVCTRCFPSFQTPSPDPDQLTLTS